MYIPYTNLESGIRSHSLERGDGYCCLTNRTEAITCEQCGSSCNHRIQIECETCQQADQQTTLESCPTSQSKATGYTRQGDSLSLNHTECSDGIITPLGAVSGVLGALLVATMVGWTVTCVVWSRSVSLKHRKFLK